MKNGRTPAPQEDKEAILDLISKGFSLRAASSEMGFHYSAVQQWRKADPDYEKRYQDAYQRGIGTIESKGLAHVLDDTKDWNGSKSNMLMFFLKQRDPSYKESAPPVQFNVNVEHRAIDMSEVAKVLKEAGALEIIEGSATEVADDQRSIPAASEVRSSRSGEQS